MTSFQKKYKKIYKLSKSFKNKTRMVSSFCIYTNASDRCSNKRIAYSLWCLSIIISWFIGEIYAYSILSILSIWLQDSLLHCIFMAIEQLWESHRISADSPVNSWSLQWRHNGVSNHQPYDCLLNRLFRRRSQKTSKLRVTSLCAGNSPGTGEFSAQMASHALK